MIFEIILIPSEIPQKIVGEGNTMDNVKKIIPIKTKTIPLSLMFMFVHLCFTRLIEQLLYLV